MNIYVNDDIKKRMDAVEGRVNWSAIAQHAFLTELRYQEALMEDEPMNSTIERLRASKEKHMQNEISYARERGMQWAKTEAEYDELSRAVIWALSELCMAPGELDELPGYEVAVAVWEDITGVEDPDDDDLTNLFNVDDVRALTAPYVFGFLTGANELWDEIEHAV